MIVGLEGSIEKKEPTSIHLNVGGVIYEVFVSVNCSAALNSSERVRLHITHIVREDSETLYGFSDVNEKRMFETLIKINGVGPKVAMAICSTFTPQDFVEVVAKKSVSRLKSVPGIGPKSASRILVELGDFELEVTPNSLSGIYQEAAMALEALGFKKEQINAVLAECSSEDVSSLVKEALKKIQKI